jgi:succinate dehydrogenase/fumarate reductase cytochrome b subunit
MPRGAEIEKKGVRNMFPAIILIIVVLLFALFATIRVALTSKEQYSTSFKRRVTTLTWLNIGFAIILVILLTIVYVSMKG